MMLLHASPLLLWMLCGQCLSSSLQQVCTSPAVTLASIAGGCLLHILRCRCVIVDVDLLRSPGTLFTDISIYVCLFKLHCIAWFLHAYVHPVLFIYRACKFLGKAEPYKADDVAVGIMSCNY